MSDPDFPGPPRHLSDAIHAAAKQGDVSALKKNLEAWKQHIAPKSIVADDLEYVLRQAVEGNQVATTAHLIDEGSTFSGETLASTFSCPDPPLDVYQLFLDRGWNLNTMTRFNRMTFLMAAVITEPRLVDWCLARGADPNVRARDGWGAMEWAPAYSSPAVIRTLVQHGGDLSRSNALHTAAGKEPSEEADPEQRIEVIDCLLDEFDLDIDAVSTFPDNNNPRGGRSVNGTPLHWAILCNNPSTVHHLMRRGANPQTRNVLGYTAFDFADDFGTDEIKSVLKAEYLPN